MASEASITLIEGESRGQVKKDLEVTLNFKPADNVKKPKVIVAIPAFNEEIAIGSVVLRSGRFADEVVVVDDGSNDHTAEVARMAGAEVITHECNSGYGAAIKTCFETAKNRNADIMIIIDADGQHDPEDIPYLIKEILDSKSDIVIGSRFVNGNGRNQKIPAYRKLGMKVLDTATNAGTGLKISDSQSGFRAYSKNAFQCIKLTNPDMGVGSEILIKAAEHNLKISEVPIKVRYDIADTSSKNPISHGVGVLNNIIGYVSQKRPLLFFGIPGAIMMVIGLICAFLLITIFNDTHSLVAEYGIGAMLFVVLGMMLITTGLTLASIQEIKTQT